MNIAHNKVYVDNLAAVMTERELRDLFSPYGNVAAVNIAIDRANHKSRGFGFVTMATSEGARLAIRALNSKAVGTCTLTVSEAWPQEQRTRWSGGAEVPTIVQGGLVNFKDTQLQQCYDHNLVEAGDAPEDQRQIHALIATHDFYQMLEGAHSVRVHETIEHLLSEGLRPELRRWYQRSGAGTDSAAIEFRDQLSRLAGERLENANENPDKPS